MRTAIVFPGQGSHRPGMASMWTGHVAAAAVLDTVGEVTGLDIVAVADDAEACERTAAAQPAIFAVSMAAHRVLEGSGVRPDLVAGHSLGEVTAAVAAGALDLRDGALLVAERGRAMGAACHHHPGTMAAVLGLDDHARDELAASLPDGVAVANENAPGQVVLSGPPGLLEAATATARDLGGRVRALRVEGAFHSPAMAPAVDAVRDVLDSISVSDPVVPLVSGVTGQVIERAQQVRSSLVDGLLAPVRWRAVQETIARHRVELVIEAGPGGVLRGLARRSLDAVTVAVDSPDALAEARSAAGVRDHDVAGHEDTPHRHAVHAGGTP